MNLNRKYSSEFVFEFAVLMLLGIAVIVIFGLYGARRYGDLTGHWKLCAYVLRGVNPYPYIGTKLSDIPSSVQDIGVISSGWSATPWGLVLGNVYYFGFLSLSDALICFYALCAMIYVALGICLYFKAGEIYPDKKFICLVLIAALGSPDFLITIHAGNTSGLICCMLIFAWLFRDDSAVVTGLMLGIAMTKPQQALLICLAFLLNKRFLPVIIAAVIDISAWFSASLLTGNGMMSMLNDFLVSSASTGGNLRFSGIFTIFLENPSAALYASMITGIILTFLIDFKYRKSNAPEHFRLCFAYLISSYWSYGSSSTFYVLLFPSIVSLSIAMTAEKKYQRIIWFIICLYMNYGEFFRSRKLIGFLLGHTVGEYTLNFFRTGYCFGLIIITVMLYLYLTRKKKEGEII